MWIRFRPWRNCGQNLDVVLACGICKNISRSEVHQLVDMIYDASPEEIRSAAGMRNRI